MKRTGRDEDDPTRFFYSILFKVLLSGFDLTYVVPFDMVTVV